MTKEKLCEALQEFTDEHKPTIEQHRDGNYTAYCPYCKKAIWRTFKQWSDEDED